MPNDLGKSLNEEPVDRLAALLKGSAGLIPIVGPVLSELVTSFIPNQRIERISKYLKELEKLISDIQLERLQEPLNVDLIEEGGFQAIRAISDQRIQLLARCVSEGLHTDNGRKLDEKRLLFIISQLDEGDVALLSAFDERHNTDKFAKLRPNHPVMGGTADAINKNHLFEASMQKLERLSLLHFSARMNRELHIPHFDQFSGRPEGHRTVTSLGRLILFRTNLRLSEEP